MLKTRIVTALILLAVLLPILYFSILPALLAVSALFLAAAIWECGRLFRLSRPTLLALIWCAVFALLVLQTGIDKISLLYSLCVAIWLIRLTPALKLGLPALESLGNRLLNGVYSISILGCFVAVVALFKVSSLYLLSVLAIVWIADIGAYFTGRAFGKRKLAPTISPGKSWEGVIGGWVAVIVVAVACAMLWHNMDIFSTRLAVAWGWLGMMIVLTIVVAASIIGDLFESQLKRRAGMKDSSNLLPGHGGVLDRIDSLIPVLPLAVLVGSWL